MPISWNEIRHRAIQFSHRWAGATREAAEKQTFWNEFFEVFGLQRRLVATFEEPVRKLSGRHGAIDLFWKGNLLVEHKSFGQDLGKAQSQAFDYIQDLAREGRQKEIPRYVIVSDFARIALHDLEPDEPPNLPLFAGRRIATVEFPLADFHRRIHDFAFIPGYKQHQFLDPDPINLEAVALMGHLHDTLEVGGYRGPELERMLVRVLFCLFADRTGIFERDAFGLYLENRTAKDGSDLGPQLARLFDLLNTPGEQRQQNLEQTLAAFPYVNGELFSERLGFADFNRDMRNALLGCTRFDWSRISPAIFGALFQAVMEPRERRQIGGHYTSERDILKLINSLFLDDLRAEVETLKADQSSRRHARLAEFQKKLANLRFLDPACGCGNFLVISYRELRALEIEVLKLLHGGQREMTLDDVNRLAQVDVDQFFGIEIGEWPARIAEVALWLMDHQMNIRLSEAFGQLYRRLPLRKSPHIHVANALRLDWRSVLPPEQCSYVLGNPPFVGKHYRTDEQRADLISVHRGTKSASDLDYVTAWYRRSADYVQGTRIVVGFVSTNSITQGEQVSLLWPTLLGRFGLKILFAHRTFRWESEARGKAHVHVVIVGFGVFDQPRKRLYDYPNADGNHATVSEVPNISPYLTAGNDTVVLKRSTPLADVPPMRCGNKPADGGHLILDDSERRALLTDEPDASQFLRKFIGSDEFINGTHRWCLWLKDVPAPEWRKLLRIRERVEKVRQFRLQSTAAPTRDAAAYPALFFYVSQPESKYIAIPEVSSERREYVPIGFLPPDIIASNKLYLVAEPSLFLFGVLQSAMHMAWMKQVAGRLESRYQYSGTVVYNTFAWPQDLVDGRRAAVESAARLVLASRVASGDGRAGFLPSRKPGITPSTLADLYDPLAMPRDLLSAHRALDRAVDRCYRGKPFTSDRERVEFLFALYEHLSAPLLPGTKTKRRNSRGSAPR